jgi:glycosyltransferase involved in cell wall biosynthesis
LDQIAANKKIQDFIDQNIPKKSSKDDSVIVSGNNVLNDESVLKIYTDIYNPFFSIKHRVDKSYAEWISDIEEPRIPGANAIKEALSTFSKKPLISILIPTYNSNIKFLRECLDSVLYQTYTHWQLCIADDASSDDQVRQTLLQYAAKDNRIKLEFRKINGHICEASNSALKLATGEYVLLLDHDDLLAKEALFFLIESINQFPQAGIIYSDEDKVDPFGKRFDPHFKSDFNPDLLYSHNYISHLGVYKRDLVESIGGFRKGLEGSQDYDLLLRCLLKTSKDKVIHIPKILYHWRASADSTALTSSNKSYTSTAGLKALKHYFGSKGEQVDVSLGHSPNTYRVSWPIPDDQPFISLIIPTRDRVEILKQCISSILERTSYQNFEILIVDNDSVEPQTLEYFKQIQVSDDRVRVLPFPGVFNYSKINNWAVEKSRGELIGLINNDIEVISGEWLTEMVSHALRPDIGAVGAKLLYKNDLIQHAGVILGIGGVAGHSHKYYSNNDQGYFSRLKLVQNYSAVTAACMVLRKELFHLAGGLDENNLKVAFNDVDFCMKITELGYRNLWTPFALLYHHESISRGVENTPEKQARFISESKFIEAKWSDKLKVDPFYNPNLTLIHEDFSLAVNE